VPAPLEEATAPALLMEVEAVVVESHELVETLDVDVVKPC
jgi:hypothetical protein